MAAPHPGVLGSAVLAFVMVSSACVTGGPAQVGARATDGNGSAEELLDARGEMFLKALQAGDDAAAAGMFTAPVRRELPAERLGEILRAMVRAHGALLSWEVIRRAQGAENDLREYNLRFERGAISVRLSFHERTRNIAGVFFVGPRRFFPDPTPGVEARVTSIDVKVGPDLGATVTAPREVKVCGGACPAVVLVPGSGPMDRDETVGTIRPFRDLAEGLAQRGIVVIRFDKRPFMYPELFERAVFTIEEEFIQDTMSAIAVVKRQPGVDGARVFLVGHSQGAQVAPEIAARVPDIAGIVMLAAPARPVLDVLIDQLKRGSAPQEVIERAEAGRRAVAHPNTPADRYVEGAPVAYWTDLGKRDFFGAARRFAGRILLLRGANDRQVLNEDQEEWIRQLAGRNGFSARTIPNLSHPFVPTAELALAARAQGKAPFAPRVPDAVIDQIALFVKQ